MYFLEKISKAHNQLDEKNLYDENDIGIIHPLLFSAFERAMMINWWNYPYRHKNFDPGSFMEVNSKYDLIEKERKRGK